MKKKTKITTYKKEKTNTKAYDLHRDAIEELVTANEDNTLIYDEKEIESYKKDKLGKIPVWLKALFIKFWFSGAVCYFVYMGLGFFLDMLDAAVVLAIVMGMVTDLLVGNIFRFFDYDGSYLKWLIFPKKKFWTFFANIIYSIILTFLVFLCYFGISIITTGGKDPGNIVIEPVFFGLLYLACDLIIIGIKNLITTIIDDANSKLNRSL